MEEVSGTLKRTSGVGPCAGLLGLTFPVTISLSTIPKLHTSVAGVDGPSTPSGAVYARVEIPHPAE